VENIDLLFSLVGSTIRLSAPLILAALAGLFCERAGIFNIGLEGMLLASAFAAACVAYATGSATLGLLSGVAAGILMNLIHGFASITHGGNQVISGVALNFFAAGVTAVLGNAWFAQGGNSPPLSGEARFDPITLPGAEALKDVPVLGPLYAQVLSGHNVLTYVAFLCVPLSAFVLYRTRFGQNLRAVGENPAAVDVVGLSVPALRYRALLVAGVIIGVAGAYLSIAQSASFVRDMSAGKGFIALAALIFAKWRPWPVLWACLLFGSLDALAAFLQGKPLPLVGEVPVQVFQAAPYVLTCLLLAGFIGHARAPRAGGLPYVKDR
jgi:simple sugar transport system permease protein